MRSSLPGINQPHPAAFEIVRVPRSKGCTLNARNGGDLSVGKWNWATSAPSLRCNLGILPCCGFLKGQDSTSEVVVKGALRLQQKLVASLAPWKNFDSVQDLGHGDCRYEKIAGLL